MKKRLAQHMQVQILCVWPELFAEQAKLRRAQRARGALRLRAEAAREVAAVRDLKIASGKTHGGLLPVSILIF